MKPKKCFTAKSSYTVEALEQLLRKAGIMMPEHPTGCGCRDCLNDKQQWGLVERYDPDSPATHGRVLHKIGRITLQMHVYRKQKIYEVLLDHILIASARDWPTDALHKAREHYHKPRQKVYGEIIAYRGWGLLGDMLTPLSRFDDYETWSGPVAHVHDIDENGSNGLWAVRIQQSRYLLDSYHPMIHGLVGLSGKVIEYERGYRAQRQAIRVLRVVPPVGDMVIKALEERYQCQVFRQKKTR